MLILSQVNLWIWLALLAGCLVYDYVNANYIRAVAEYDRWKAALTSSFLVVVGGIFTLEYVQNPWNLIPIATGCFLGTLLSFNKYKIKPGKMGLKKQWWCIKRECDHFNKIELPEPLRIIERCKHKDMIKQSECVTPTVGHPIDKMKMCPVLCDAEICIK
jgi:hypothetical protein